jgi:hypothetical protein
MIVSSRSFKIGFAIILSIVICFQLYLLFSHHGVNSGVRGVLSKTESVSLPSGLESDNHLYVKTVSELNSTLHNLHAKISKQKLVKTSTATKLLQELPPTNTSGDNIASMSRSQIGNADMKKRRAVIFTMDSMEGYVRDSKAGGAAGEIMIRRCLEDALRSLNVEVVIVTSDQQFNNINHDTMGSFDIILLDPWTWAAPGWKPKRNIHGYEERIYILDFFGSPYTRNHGLKIPPERILTAFGSPWNTALGYFIREDELKMISKGKATERKGGVIWGKDPKHFSNLESMLKKIADAVSLKATSRRSLFRHNNVAWLGHQTRQSWLKLLSESHFLLGLGNPLLGPSAIDAIISGAVYINPMYKKPMRDRFQSQHDFAMEKIGSPFVCSYPEGDAVKALDCIKSATSSEREVVNQTPLWFRRDEYMKRIQNIFKIA